MYPVYQLHMLLHRQPFTIVSLSNVIAYNISGFHALYSNFIQYLIRFVIHINFPC